MTEKIKTWQKHYVDVLENPKNFDLESEREEFLIRLKIMQHERLVHLIVTMSVLITLALCAIIAMYEHMMWIICIILFVLEIFYLKHYYFLENTTQSFYDLYDKFEDLIKEGKNGKDN